MAKYFIRNGMDEREITNVDSVVLKTDDGQIFELYFRKSDNEISLSCERGALVIRPRASNNVYLENKR